GSGTIKVIDLVRIHQLHRICISSFRRLSARRPWRANADALGIWEDRPSRSRSRHETFVPTFAIERFIRTRRRDHRGVSFLRFLRDRISCLLLHSRFARLRAGSGLWRLSFALCMRLLIGACWLLRFLLWLSRLLLRLSRRRRLRRHIGSFLRQRLQPHGTRVPIIVARSRIRQWQTREHPSPSYH